MNVSIAPPVPIAVQDGTGPNSVSDFVDRFKRVSRHGVENTIRLATILVEAEAGLSTAEFETFCNDVLIKRGKSEHKKFRTIGKNAARFEQHMDKLPNNWTTIYDLAKMDSTQFDKLVAEGRLSPRLKAREILEFTGRKRNVRNGGELYVVFNDSDDDTKAKISEALQECLAPFGDKAKLVQSGR